MSEITYKLQENGGVIRSDGASIPNSTKNRDWIFYLDWLADGNTPEPECTEAETAENLLRKEVSNLKHALASQQIWMFRMILELWDAIKLNTDAQNSDIDPDVLAKAAAWKTKLDRLKEIDE